MKLWAESIMSLQNDLTSVRGKRRWILGIRDINCKSNINWFSICFYMKKIEIMVLLTPCPMSRFQSLGRFIFLLKKYKKREDTLNRKQVGGIWKTCHLLTCSCLNSANGNWFWHPRWQAYCSSDWEYASVQAARKKFPKWEDKFCILVQKTFSV